MRILVSGASGYIGRALVRALTGDGTTHVVRLVRGPADEPDVVHWDPARKILDPVALNANPEPIDAVVHLSGATLAQRWTTARKREIVMSRVESTALLARVIATLPQPPRMFVSASAVGYYGNSGDTVVDESSPAGTGFLADICAAWEAAAAPAVEAGIRVAHPRFGVVLGAGGGMLASLLPIFRLGLGGKLGDGSQWLSWIALEDAVAAIRFVLARDTVRGPINVTAPTPVTNAMFVATLGRVLGRPAIATVPARILRWTMGTMADEMLLSGQRVYPRVLEAAGFAFRLPSIEGALRAALVPAG